MSDSFEIYKQFGLAEPKPFSTDLKLHIGEENGDFRLIIKHHLQKIGFSNVRTQKDGLEILATLKSEPADVIVEGDDLPRLGGYDLLKELCEDPQAQRPAFVIISKPLNKSELMLALERGVDDMMVRPIVPGDLLPKIKSAYENFINPRNPERLYEYAKAKIRDNDLDEAYKVYLAISAFSEKAARPLVGMGRVNMLRGKLDEAIKFVSRGIERNENYIHAYSLRGEIYAKQNKIEEALTDLKKAVNLSPLNIARYQQCCEILVDQGRFAECIQILAIGIEAGLTDPYVSERIGYCHFMTKEYPIALKFLKEAVRLDPTNNSFANSLAICYRDSNDLEKAVSTYNQILKRSLYL